MSTSRSFSAAGSPCVATLKWEEQHKHQERVPRSKARPVRGTLSSMSNPPYEACTSIFAGVLERSSPILKTVPGSKVLMYWKREAIRTGPRTVHHVFELVHE